MTYEVTKYDRFGVYVTVRRSCKLYKRKRIGKVWSQVTKLAFDYSLL